LNHPRCHAPRPAARLTRASNANTSLTVASSDNGTNAGDGHGAWERRRRNPRVRATSAQVRAGPEAVEVPSGTASARACAQAAASATPHPGARGAAEPQDPHARDEAHGVRATHAVDVRGAPPRPRVEWRRAIWLPATGALSRPRRTGRPPGPSTPAHRRVGPAPGRTPRKGRTPTPSRSPDRSVRPGSGQGELWVPRQRACGSDPRLKRLELRRDTCVDGPLRGRLLVL
jgi:hypothetical protein